MNNYKNIQQTDITNKTIFIRSDMNIPLTTDNQIADDTRIKASLATIQYALNYNAKIVLATHLGRPTEGSTPDQSTSVRIIAQHLAKLLGLAEVRVLSLDEVATNQWHHNKIVMLENVRLNSGEKKNAPDLAKRYAQNIDVFVHDAFATAHRKEASTYGIASYTKDKCAGILFDQEYKALSKVIHATGNKLAVIGGSKVSTKLAVLKNLAQKVNHLCLGGGILNTFLMAKGMNIGKSLVETTMLEDVKEIIRIMDSKNSKILLPEYVVTTKELSPNSVTETKAISEILDEDIIIDIASQSAQKITEYFKSLDLIVWNGPVGIFEWDNASAGTKIIAEAIAQSKAYSVAGGGDSIAAINKFKIEGIDYVSTAGGAMLEFLAGDQLPGVEILEK